MCKSHDVMQGAAVLRRKRGFVLGVDEVQGHDLLHHRFEGLKDRAVRQVVRGGARRQEFRDQALIKRPVRNARPPVTTCPGADSPIRP